MASTTDYLVVRYGSPGNAFQPINQPMGASVVVAGGAFAITDGTTGNIKDAAGSLTSNDIVWGLILQATTATSTAGQSSVEIQRGNFFLPADGTLSQGKVGQTVYVSGEQQVSINSNANTRPVAGILEAVDTTQYGGYVIRVGAKDQAAP